VIEVTKLCPKEYVINFTVSLADRAGLRVRVELVLNGKPKGEPNDTSGQIGFLTDVVPEERKVAGRIGF